MTKQEEIELCELLVKLLAEMNVNSDKVFYNKSIIGFNMCGKRVKATIEFEVGDADE